MKNFALGENEYLKLMVSTLKENIVAISERNELLSFYPADRQVVQRIASQLAVVLSNISAIEEVVDKEREKSFLLDFSHDIAAVRSKKDLSAAIGKALGKFTSVSRYIISTISQDGITMSNYIFDGTLQTLSEAEDRMITTDKFPLKGSIADRVVSGSELVVFDVEQVLNDGNAPPCFSFWKRLNIKRTLAGPLRTGNRNLGILWVDTDELSPVFLKCVCAQVSVALANILTNEELITYRKQLELENDHLQQYTASIYNFSNIVGKSVPMQQVYQLTSVVSPSKATVLVYGETGTGKELMAKAIHEASPRKNKTMIKVNCAALPANLIESELFGHEKGAFTGAYERRIGKFELAHNGTLFLDEIGELPLEQQGKLLRAIQEREFERIGGKTTIKVDVRIVAATNRDLMMEVNAGRFRADLYYRLNVFPIVLPPLRERPEDIPDLAYFFLSRYNNGLSKNVTGISAKVMQELKSYYWPGNVRELEYLIERSVLLSDSRVLRKIYLPNVLAAKPTNEAREEKTLQAIERDRIIEVVRLCAGKISGKGGAAEVLKIPPSTLNSKMKKLDITRVFAA